MGYCADIELLAKRTCLPHPGIPENFGKEAFFVFFNPTPFSHRGNWIYHGTMLIFQSRIVVSQLPKVICPRQIV